MTVLPFIVGVSAFAQSVSMYPQQLSLAAPAGSPTPAVTTVTVVSSPSNLQFDAAVRYLTPESGWLSVSPSTGAVPATLTISADASKLPAGTYRGQVTVSAGPSRIGAWVDVYFTVGSGTGGDVAVSPSSLTFIGETNSAPQTLSVASATGASGAVQYSAFASSAGNWLSVKPPTGTLPATLNVTTLVVGLNTGSYSGTITITPAGGRPTVVPVSLIVGGTGAGTITLSQTAVTIRHQIGTPAPPLQAIDVLTSSGASLPFTAGTTTPWIGLVTAVNQQPASSVTGLAPGEFGVVIQPTGLAAGTYAGTVTVAVSGQPPQDVPVSLTVTSTPALNANPSMVVIDDTFGTESHVVVTSTDSANVSFTAAVFSSTSKITVAPTSGTLAGGFAVLAVKADTTGLAPGTFLAAIILSVQTSGATFNIPLRLIVNPPATEPITNELKLATQSVEFTAIVGEANPSQTVVMTASGQAQNFTAAATSAGGWLSVAPFSGIASPATPILFTITANSTAALPGPLTGKITVTSLVTGEQQTIDVSFTLLPRVIAADKVSLAFVQRQRGVVPPPQTILITANAPSPFAVGNRSSWITVTPTEGATPSALTVSVNPAGLPAGANKGSFELNGPNRLTIAVSLEIPEIPAPTVAPSSVTFAHELGSPAPKSQSIAIGSNTGTAVAFSASAAVDAASGVNWLTITPTSGSTPATVTAGVNTAQLVPGQHSGSITITPTDGLTAPKTVAVTLTVSASTVVVRQLLNAATLAPTPVSPGQIVTITGAGVGPAVGVVASPTAAGAIETRLADVRVLFDGVPAPLLFVRSDQINAIVPYALHGRALTRLQLEVGSSFSLPIDFRVVDAAPGIFTTAGSGRGQAAALNVDYTPNSLANPAQRGSVITVFGTGEGQTNPPGQDGRIILSDLRRPLLPVVARIGGRLTEVLYAGSAPTLVSGAFQANVRIPEDIEPGTVPIEIEVGGLPAQADVTIVVR